MSTEPTPVPTSRPARIQSSYDTILDTLAMVAFFGALGFAGFGVTRIYEETIGAANVGDLVKVLRGVGEIGAAAVCAMLALLFVILNWRSAR